MHEGLRIPVLQGLSSFTRLRSSILDGLGGLLGILLVLSLLDVSYSYKFPI
jgi:hypothetical protein